MGNSLRQDSFFLSQGLNKTCIFTLLSLFRHCLRRSAGAGGAHLLVVALLEEEALVVGLHGVGDGVHGPEVAVAQQAALVGAGEGVGHVEVVHVHDVVQGGAAGVVAVEAVVQRGVGGA